MDVSVLKNIN